MDELEYLASCALEKDAALRHDVVPLQPYQQEVAATGHDPESRLLIYHSLGSGKTRTALGAAEATGQPYTAIVPASLKSNLLKERARWTDEKTPLDLESYNALAAGKVQPADTLILDEAQRLRSPGSQSTQQAIQLADQAKHLYLLSGTPIVNHPHDLAPLIRMLSGKAYSPQEFDSRFVDERTISPGFFGWLRGVKPVKVPAIGHESEFENLLRGHVHYHEPARPDVTEEGETHTVEMGPEQSRLYRGFWDELPFPVRWKLQNDFPLSRQELIHLSSFLSGPRQVGLSTLPFMKGNPDAQKAFQQSPKLQKAFALLRSSLQENPAAKAMVYSNFVDAGLTPYAAALQQAKIPYALFHGGIPEAARKQAVLDYNAGKIRALLVGPAGSEGISLKGTRLMQLLDPHWNSARTTQAVGRGIRFDSHTDLPAADRNVRVQRFYSRLPDSFFYKAWKHLIGRGAEPEDARRESPGVDYYLSRLNERKDELNQVFLDKLKALGSEKQAEAPEAGAKILRDAFLYMEPEPPLEQFASCASCERWTGPEHERCLLLGPDLEVAADDTCGLYVHGAPAPGMAGQERAVVDPVEVGFREGPVQCRNCVSYEPGEDENTRGRCMLYRDLNEALPAHFDLDADVHQHGCCNAQMPVEKGLTSGDDDPPVASAASTQ